MRSITRPFTVRHKTRLDKYKKKKVLRRPLTAVIFIV